MKMKITLVWILALLCFGSFQESSGTGRTKIWIFLKDRPYLNSEELSAKHLARFSPEAVNRRTVRGEPRLEESDFSVDPSYVKALESSGARILVESRWLNAVSARCDDSCREKVTALSFVKEIRPVVTYRRRPEVITDVPAFAAEVEETTGLKYGQSKAQLTQLNVPKVHRKGYAGQGEIVAIFDTGFRKDHIAFKDLTVVAEHDFVFGDDNVTNGGDSDSHGTGTWSCVGGAAPGKLYGAAYKASFLLANTEDVRSESQVEEDNWVAAFEWADKLGASVINSSLGYRDWYQPSDFNGATAVTTIIANTAAKKGIVVANSAGNEGPGVSTLNAPADAKKILTVGAVNANGLIADFSSRGPTADGRLKPEVVARGVATVVANNRSSTSFGASNGTSFSSPLVAGCAAALLSARPDWKPKDVIEAMTMTASQADAPDNTYGYGIVNLLAAIDYLPKKSVVLDHKELKDTSNTTKPYALSVRARAQRGLNDNAVFLFWKVQGESGYKMVQMSADPSKEDYFLAEIPAQSKGSTIQYYFRAQDVKGRKRKLPNKAPKQGTFDFMVR